MAHDEDQRNTHVLPVLLGSGANAYGLARGFYQEFGVRSLAVGPSILLQCRNSRIVDTRVLPDLATDDGFVPSLHALATELKATDPDLRLLIIACGDTTAALLAHHRDEIAQDYLTATVDGATLDRAVDKVAFWRLCEQAGVGTPLTAVYSYDDFTASAPIPEPAEYPLELKAADSVAYLAVQFEGRKKAYTIQNRDELTTTVHAIYEHGYRGDLIIQEFIPGDDTEMRTLNAYINMDGSVAMMCMGNPLMEEYAPSRIGNYAAIVSEGDDEVYRQCTTLMQTLRYTGFANFDIKRDPRDGSYRFLEINPRPGGSSDYVTQAGFNLARWIWRDLVLGEHHEPAFCHNRHLWIGTPRFVVRRFAPQGSLKNDALQLMREGRCSKSAHWSKDMNPRRALELFRWQFAITRDFMQYAPRNGSGQA